MMSALDDVAHGPWLDVGGGMGGTASWIERTYHRHVIVADAATGSLRAARQLFASLDVVAALASSLPIRDHGVQVAVVNGVVSLLDDPDQLLAERRRVLVSNGRVVVTDLWSTNSETVRNDPNTFRAVEDIARLAEGHGFRVQHVAAADLSTGWWSSTATDINDEIANRHASDPGYEHWRRDLDHLDEIIGARTVIPAGLLLG